MNLGENIRKARKAAGAKGTCRAPVSLPERYKPLGKRRKNAERASVCENLQRA